MKNSILQPKNEGIYILTNTVNNKQYVGMDSNMPRRFKQHIKGIARCPLLHDALSAFGLDKWTVQFIPYPRISNATLRAVEQWYISKLNTKHPDGYNMREGSNPNLKQKRAKHLTPAAKHRAELKAQVRERREQGVLLETIADEFDISRGTVFEWCKGVKVVKDTIRRICEQRRAEKAAKDAKLRIKALQLKEKGFSLRQIADELDSNPSKIRRLLFQKS